MKRIACLAACILMTGAANAAVIDFENVAPTGGGTLIEPSTPYIDGDFTLTTSESGAAILDSNPSGFLPATPSDWFAFSDTNIVTLTSNTTSTFNLFSFLAGPPSPFYGLNDLFITANVFDGTTLTAQLANLMPATPTTLNWYGLTSVSFSTNSVGGLDNIVADIPEPAPLGLLALGMIGLGITRNKKK